MQARLFGELKMNKTQNTECPCNRSQFKFTLSVMKISGDVITDYNPLIINKLIKIIYLIYQLNLKLKLR